MSKEKEQYDEVTLLVLARVAESVEDYKTMQTYVKLIIDKRINNTEANTNTSINRESVKEVRILSKLLLLE